MYDCSMTWRFEKQSQHQAPVSSSYGHRGQFESLKGSKSTERIAMRIAVQENVEEASA